MSRERSCGVDALSLQPQGLLWPWLGGALRSSQPRGCPRWAAGWLRQEAGPPRSPSPTLRRWQRQPSGGRPRARGTGRDLRGAGRKGRGGAAALGARCWGAALRLGGRSGCAGSRRQRQQQQQHPLCLFFPSASFFSFSSFLPSSPAPSPPQLLQRARALQVREQWQPRPWVRSVIAPR